MKEIKIEYNETSDDKDAGGMFFNPESEDGVLRCCCGFELVQESEDTYRCIGGNHRYMISKGEVIIDKFGRIMLKMPVKENE